MCNTFSFISDSLNEDDSRFIFSLASKEKKGFVKNFNKFTDYGSDNIKLITYLLEHFFRLLVIKIKMYEGIDFKARIYQWEVVFFVYIYDKSYSFFKFRVFSKKFLTFFFIILISSSVLISKEIHFSSSPK